MSGDPFASAAAYRAKGWVGTLPLPLGRKTPPPAGFTGDGGAWPSPADLADWAEQAPQNIALRLPPNVIALDVDDAAAFLGLVELVGPLPPTWRAHSGGDRLGHLYYRLPAGVVSTGWGAPCPGVDLLRHGHRYSIVAPSVHPSGTTYQWAHPGGSLGNSFPGPGDLPELPAAWVDYLAGDSDVDQRNNVDSHRERRDDFGTVGDAIPHGRHQEWLFLYACSLRARGVPEEEAAALVRLRAKQDCRPPWAGPDDAWDAVSHAYRRYPEGEAPSSGPALTLVGAPEPAPVVEAIEAGEAFPVVDWFEAWQAPEAEDWILEPLIAASRGIALYSAPKLGKSLLMLEVAVAVSQGKPVIGMTPPRRRTVLYVDHENDLRGDIVRRLRSMGYGPEDLTNLRYLNLPIMGSLDEARGGAELLAVALREGAELVVIDTVSRTISGEENSNDTWISFYRHTGKALKAAGIACVRLDHSGKDETRGQRGASAKSGDVDAVWQLTRSGDNEFALYCEAQRMGIAEAQRTLAFRRLDEPHLRHERVAPPTRLSEEAKRLRAIWIALEEAGLNVDPTNEDGSPKTGRAIERELTEAGITFTKGLAASVVKARWAYLHNDFCPLPSYVEASGAPAPALTLATPAQEGCPEVPRGAPGVPRTAPGGACPAPSAPHAVGGGTGAPSPAEGTER